MSAADLTTRQRVRQVLRRMQDEQRQGPPCATCGKPKVTIRLAIGAVVHTGPRLYRAQQLESAADLGACQCAEPGVRGYYDPERIGQVIDQLPELIGMENRRPARER